jgi:integrase
MVGCFLRIRSRRQDGALFRSRPPCSTSSNGTWTSSPERGESGRVFVGGKGGMLRRQNFRKIWLKAVAESGVPAVHFHDLRHTGNTLVAENGATLRELMERMGHASTRAALIYLHVSKGRSKHLWRMV